MSIHNKKILSAFSAATLSIALIVGLTPTLQANVASAATSEQSKNDSVQVFEEVRSQNINDNDVFVSAEDVTYIDHITLNDKFLTKTIGDPFDLRFKYGPAGSINEEFVWTSSNPDVIRIETADDGHQILYYVAPGTTVLTVSTKTGPTVSDSCTVTVKAKTSSEGDSGQLIETPGQSPITSDGEAETTQDVKVNLLKLNETNITRQIGEPLNLSYTYGPSGASNAKFVWSSSNPNVIRVSKNDDGKTVFTYAGVGETILTIATEDNSISSSCTVTVTPKQAELIKVTSLKFKQSSLTVTKGDKIELPYSYSPTGASNADFAWSSSDLKVIEIVDNDDGTQSMFYTGTGIVDLTIATKDGSISDTCRVTVVPKEGESTQTPSEKLVTSLQFTKHEITAKMGEEIDMQYTYAPKDATNADFVWSSSNANVMKIVTDEKGEQSFKVAGPGTATITIATKDGSKYDSCVVTIEKSDEAEQPTTPDPSQENKVAMLQFNSKEVTYELGEPISLGYTYGPDGATNAQFVWSSSNEDVIRVVTGLDGKQSLLYVGTGTTILRIATVDGSLSDTCLVTVKPSESGSGSGTSKDVLIEQVKFNEHEITINADENLSLGYSYSPANATNKNFIWSSSNTSVIKITNNANGKPTITVVGTGTTTLTIKAEGSDAYDTCIVNILSSGKTEDTPDNKKLEYVTLNQHNITKTKGESLGLQYTFGPVGSTNAVFHWTSSNEDVVKVVTIGNEESLAVVGTGTTVLTIKSEDSTVEDSCTVTITAPSGGNENLLTYLKFHNKDIETDFGSSLDLTYSYGPSNATNAEFVWSSSNENVVKFITDQSGKSTISVVGIGESDITIATKDGSIKDTCHVKINPASQQPSEPKLVETLTLTRHDITIKRGESLSLDYSYGPADATNAKFKWTSSNSNVISITTDENGKQKMSIKGEGTTNITISTTDGSISDTCKITVIPNDATSTLPSTPGKSQIVPNGIYYISSSINVGKVLDVKSASPRNGGNIQIYSKNNSNAQKFKFVYDQQTDSYMIQNMASGKVLDLNAGKCTNGNNIHQWLANGTKAQRWKITKDGSAYRIASLINPNYVLDLENGSVTNGRNIRLWKTNSSAAQKWLLTETTCPTGVLMNGLYEFAPTSNLSKRIDIANGSKLNKANVQLYSRNGTDAQRYVLTYDGNGYYTIKNLKSGKVLDAKNGGTSNQTNVWQYTANGSSAQKWKITKNSDNTYTITNKKSGKALDMVNGSTKNGTNIWLYTSNGSKAQKWIATNV